MNLPNNHDTWKGYIPSNLNDFAVFVFGGERRRALRGVAAGRPGEVFHSRIAWLDPLLDPRTRTATVRLNVANTSAVEATTPRTFR